MGYRPRQEETRREIAAFLGKPLPPPTPPRKQYRSPPGPTMRLGMFSQDDWFWIICPSCLHRVATKAAIFSNSLGPDSPLDALRERAWCTMCGHFGAQTYRPSHVDIKIGDEPFDEERSYYRHLQKLEDARAFSYLVYDREADAVRRDRLTLAQSVAAALRYGGLRAAGPIDGALQIIPLGQNQKTLFEVPVTGWRKWGGLESIHACSRALLAFPGPVGRYRAMSFDHYRMTIWQRKCADVPRL